MQYESTHIRFVAPVKLNYFLNSEKNGAFAVKRCCPACAVAKPEVQNDVNIGLGVKKLFEVCIKSVNRNLKISAHKINFFCVECSLKHGQNLLFKVIFLCIAFTF